MFASRSVSVMQPSLTRVVQDLSISTPACAICVGLLDLRGLRGSVCFCAAHTLIQKVCFVCRRSSGSLGYIWELVLTMIG